MPVAWYDVLVQLYLAPGHAMRMSDLANAGADVAGVG